jgi:ABC-type nitrate/sulfonate/bicarbonate transport system substrate-binding protein
MKRVLFTVLALFGFTLYANAQSPSPINLNIFPGGLSWPVFVAQDHGFFERENLRVKVTETPGSVAQIKGTMAGEFDIAITPFDNVVAYQEGQGEVALDTPPDLFIFMGGMSSSLRLIARPDIGNIAELRGKTIAVDALTTGYTLLMYLLLDRAGLPQGSYALERFGGTASRVQALLQGKVAATMVSSPQEVPLEQQGYKRLGDVQPMLGPYQTSCGVARRSWAAAHRSDVVRYARAMVAATEWLRNPANRAEAVRLYRARIPNVSQELAEKAWDVMNTGPEGFQPMAKFDPAGARLALEVRNQYGVPKKQLGDWRKYVDESFYADATK